MAGISASEARESRPGARKGRGRQCSARSPAAG
jgi:hypothetical protein